MVENSFSIPEHFLSEIVKDVVDKMGVVATLIPVPSDDWPPEQIILQVWLGTEVLHKTVYTVVESECEKPQKASELQ